jgi:competence protein ComEA
LALVAIELARALRMGAARHSSLTDLADGGSVLVGTNDVPRRSSMTRLIALLVALAFALGAGTTPAWAQAPKEPAKPEQKAPPAAKKEPLNIKSASADELKTLKGIGEADATKIVENRPYKTTDDLIKKNVVSKATYDKIKDQIVANHFHLGSTPSSPSRRPIN